MLVRDFLKEIEKLNLPLSQGLDLAAFILNIPYEQVKSSYNVELDSDKVTEVLNKLNNHIPAAYITNRREFYGRVFYVDENVLIPRVETEILIEEVVKRYKNKSGLEIIDICSGSGIIGLTLKKELENSCVTLLDISKKAVEVSKKNGELLQISNNVEYICSDILLYTSSKKYDIVVCNPPYLSNEEYNNVEEEVKKEPVNALTAGEDGFLFYKKILEKFSMLCKEQGKIFFETGYNQGSKILDFASGYNLKAEGIKDYALNDRVVVVYK